jgi:hypothetical protein
MVVKAAILWLNNDSDIKVAQDTDTILAALKDNENFPTPTPTLALITTTLTEFRAAMADAAKGGREATAVKNAKRASLVSLMRGLASYLTTTSGGDLAKLLSSKYPVQKPSRTPIGQLPPPSVPYLQQGKAGQMLASIPPVYGASIINWRVALKSAPDVYVQTAQTPGGRVTFNGLTRGQAYLVQANAVGAAGPSDYSDAAELMVV